MSNQVDNSIAITANANFVNQADYLKLFMQELTYQDPLKPVDNREFMAQMAQFSSLQEAKASKEALQLLTSMMSANQSLMLLGKNVKLKGSDKEGIVRKIEFPENSAPIVHVLLNGSEILQAQLTDITDVWG